MKRARQDVTITAAEIADRVQGKILGAETAVVTHLCTADSPQQDGVVFLRGKHASRLGELLKDGLLSAVLVEHCDESIHPDRAALIVVEDAQRAFMSLIDVFYETLEPERSSHPSASIDPSARIGKNVSVGAFCVIGVDAVIEDNAVLHPHVVIYPGAHIGAGSVLHSGVVIREFCRIGPQSVIQNGAVIGADGFGYIPDETMGLQAVPQLGEVHTDERVDVGANSCIDRGAIGNTSIGTGTKIDNLVQIGHNCRIGSYSIICGQSALAGSVQLGNQVILGGSTGVSDHVKITDGVRTAARSGVIEDLELKQDYAGHPSIPAGEWKRREIYLRRLPKLIKQIKSLIKSENS